ncbi:AcrR family transcriptional regulator [Bradyrhizobium japonicum]|uniref:TetR/AcrR family transcriptional regulator n=1 Tax=Bradyrhizobium japonicum TaxID=375 RepID=UPI002168191D|nr:TetR/AcrR family transcriptional regulator [Bradyrhizobium japonicum]MCS3495611.1 AcrR family transcriptional regulator [Bradyrhizobium japonicum]MCS3962227.1 AcrR family transcriptional regulator [Bradyrhizobium japonicum]MCS3994544.1 AcrR family transcriptional regulator [Bradyrhizobium japonicum]
MPRPRSFDLDEAIKGATALFWKNGYQGTSLADLTSEIGIAPASLYFAFDSKAGLFRQVLNYYYQAHLGRVDEKALNQPTAREVVETMLYGLVDLYTDKTHPPGCLSVKCSQAYAEEAEVQDELMKLRHARRKRLASRFRTAREMGDLPANTDSDALALFAIVVGWGLAFAAQTGASRADLRRTVETSLRGWPT